MLECKREDIASSIMKNALFESLVPRLVQALHKRQERIKTPCVLRSCLPVEQCGQQLCLQGAEERSRRRDWNISQNWLSKKPCEQTQPLQPSTDKRRPAITYPKRRSVQVGLIAINVIGDGPVGPTTVTVPSRDASLSTVRLMLLHMGSSLTTVDSLPTKCCLLHYPPLRWHSKNRCKRCSRLGA